MTRTLRTRHRHAVMVLALVLPVGVALALAARPSPTPAAALGSTGLDPGADTAPLAVARDASAGDDALRIAARIGFPAATGASHASARGTTADHAAPAAALDLEVRSATGQPELLAYWSPTSPAGEALPGGSVLLGAVRFAGPRRFALPEAARTHAGAVVLYSLAQGRVAAALALPAALDPPGRAAGAR